MNGSKRQERSAHEPAARPVNKIETASKTVRDGHRHVSQCNGAYLFVLPAVLILAVFVLAPFVNTIRYAFTDATLFYSGSFVGLDNFRTLLTDSIFWTAMLNSSLYVVCVVPFMVILPLILASLVAGDSRILGFFRTAFYVPVVMSAVVVGLIWTNILDTNGLINSAFQAMHIIAKPIPFLTDRWLLLFSAMFITIWLGLGYYMIIYLSALANIDDSLYEAASIDGAGPIRQFLSITMPGCRSTIVLIMLMSSIAAFRVFNEVYVLTGGSNGIGGEDVTMTMLIKSEGTGLTARVGYASAISIVLIIVLGTLILLQTLLQRKKG